MNAMSTNDSEMSMGWNDQAWSIFEILVPTKAYVNTDYEEKELKKMS